MQRAANFRLQRAASETGIADVLLECLILCLTHSR